VYVLWDIYCLSHHGAVLQRSQEDITAWRRTLYTRIQLLDPYKGKKQRPFKVVQNTEDVIDINED
jgi:hypothetical protein